MSNALEAAKVKAEETYNAASDNFDAVPLAFWDRYGRRTIERMRLHAGARVLDVCCGAGASALRAVGPEGTVIAVDLAEELLNLGRAKANAAGLRCVDFRRADMTSLGFPAAHFDAVVCVFGIFFVPDMEAQVAELWRMGDRAVSWRSRHGDQASLHPRTRRGLLPCCACVPISIPHSTPWDRITTSDAVRKLFADAGVQNVEVVPEEGYQALRAPEDFWTIALGSGLRWTIDQMGPEVAHGVQREILDALVAKGVDRVGTNVIYAIARADSA